MRLLSRVFDLRIRVVFLVAPLVFALWSRTLGGPLLERLFAPVEGLPPYALDFDGGSVRQEAGLAPLFSVRRDAVMSVVLRPAESVQGPVELRAFRGRGGELRRWGAVFTAREAGGFVLRGRPRELPELGPGRWEIVLLLGRPSALPANPHSVPEGPGGEAWQVLRLNLEVEGSEGGADASARGGLFYADVRAAWLRAYGGSIGRCQAVEHAARDKGASAMPQGWSHSSMNPAVVQYDAQRASQDLVLGCLDLVRRWAKDQAAEGKQKRVLALLDELALVVSNGDKIEPGTRTADEKVEPGTRTAGDKIEPGTRSARDKIEPEGTRSARDKIEPEGTRSAPEPHAVSTRTGGQWLR